MGQMPIISHLLGLRLRGKKPYHGGVEVLPCPGPNANYWGSARLPGPDSNGINKKRPVPYCNPSFAYKNFVSSRYFRRQNVV
jgi:hypothetical protein